MNAHDARARFEPLLAGLDRGDLDAVQDPTCGVFADDGVIGYVNRAWLEFGRANGAQTVSGPGIRLLDAITEPLRGFYAEQFARVLADGQPWEQDYECSSATLHREYRLLVVAIAGGAGLLITHALRVEVPHRHEALPFVQAQYQAANGLITLCSYCRRVRQAASPAPARWDWVPALVAHATPNVSHGICERCAAYYFGPAALSV